MLVRTKTLEPFNAFIDSSTRSKLLSSPIILTKTVLLLFVIFSFWVTNLFALFYFPNKFLYYGFVVPSLAFLSRALCFCLGIVWVRTKNFPTTFPLITISNHLSFADSPLLFFLLQSRECNEFRFLVHWPKLCAPFLWNARTPTVAKLPRYC